MLEARPTAKVNLTLDVGPRREDGYHELRSVFLRIGLADRLTVAPSAGPDTLTLGGLPCPIEGNLVLRAFDLLRRAADPNLPGLEATLDKQIPVGAGLAGGSSDGAAALDLAAAAWGIGLSPGQRAELALTLGSDVPFFAANVPAALVEGRGEHVTALPSIGDAGILLAVSPSALSTAAVFERFDALAPTTGTDATISLADALRTGLSGAQLAALAPDLVRASDLWPAAASLAPELVKRRAYLERLSGRSWLLSGSGPTLFSIYPTAAEAVAVGSSLAGQESAELGGVMLCATDLLSPEPAWRHQWPIDH